MHAGESYTSVSSSSSTNRLMGGRFVALCELRWRGGVVVVALLLDSRKPGYPNDSKRVSLQRLARYGLIELIQRWAL